MIAGFDAIDKRFNAIDEDLATLKGTSLNGPWRKETSPSRYPPIPAPATA